MTFERYWRDSHDLFWQRRGVLLCDHVGATVFDLNHSKQTALKEIQEPAGDSKPPKTVTNVF